MVYYCNVPGDTALAESIENIFYNAAQGARHPYHSCIAYLKTDNSYQMDGTRNGDAEPGKDTKPGINLLPFIRMLLCAVHLMQAESLRIFYRMHGCRVKIAL